MKNSELKKAAATDGKVTGSEDTTRVAESKHLETLSYVWKKSKKMIDEGNKMRNEGYKIRDEGNKMQNEGNKMRDEGIEMQNEGSKMREKSKKMIDEGNKMGNEGIKMWNKGNKMRNKGSKMRYGVIKMWNSLIELLDLEGQWDKDFKTYTLSTGEVFN